jgi:hypothetical protein
MKSTKNITQEPKGSIVLYTTPDGKTQLDVKLENETVWLTQEQMSELFQRNRTVITRHISNIFKEKELEESLVCAKFALPIAESRPEEKDIMVKVVVNLINQNNN